MARSKPRKTREPKLVPTAVQQVEIAALHGFIDKAERGEPLTAEEAQALRATVSATAYLTAEIKRKRVSLQRLRDWLFGASTEKTAAVCPPPEKEAGPAEPENGEQASGEPKADKPKRKGHGRNPASCYRGAERVKVAHECRDQAAIGGRGHARLPQGHLFLSHSCCLHQGPGARSGVKNQKRY